MKIHGHQGPIDGAHVGVATENPSRSTGPLWMAVTDPVPPNVIIYDFFANYNGNKLRAIDKFVDDISGQLREFHLNGFTKVIPASRNYALFGWADLGIKGTIEYCLNTSIGIALGLNGPMRRWIHSRLQKLIFPRSTSQQNLKNKF